MNATTCSTIEPARPGDGGLVAGFIADSLPPPLRGLTIWASPRARHWVEGALGGTEPGLRRRFYLLRSGGAALGLAAFRTLDGAAFLDHLYITPPQRGRGLGARLLASAASRYLAAGRGGPLALDVFSPRPAVEAWYARLGFEERGRRWWSVAAVAPARGCRVRLEGLDRAAREHRAWGFSSFTAVEGLEGRRFTVGRLYSPYFRFSGLRSPEEALLPGPVGGALISLDPARRLLLISTQEPASPAWRQVAHSRRLEASAKTLLERLGACPETPC